MSSADELTESTPITPAEPTEADQLRLLVTQLQGLLTGVLKQRGLLDEVSPGGAAADYASAGDLIALDDLAELDVVVKRWHVSGRPLKLRVRALDLDQQEQIDIEATVKHPVTGEWVRSEAAYSAATLREGVIVPKLDNAKAQQLRKRNPTIIKELVSLIWTLSALDDDLLEQLVNIDDPTPPTPAELSPASDD
jgi:hypothetical protein